VAEIHSGNKNILKRLLGTKWLVQNLFFVVFLAFLAIAYIANNHWADKTIRNISKTQRALKELKFEYKTLKSEVIFKSRETELIKAAEPLGLSISKESPVRLLAE
jgi:cell division protein FtsL